MGLGVVLMELLIPVFELFLPIIPGDVFPYFFGETVRGYPVLSLQRALQTRSRLFLTAQRFENKLNEYFTN